MPKFFYIAMTPDGQRLSGSLVAISDFVAGHQLKEQGLTPLSLRQAGRKAFAEIGIGGHHVSLTEKLTFVENLELMLKSGIPVVRCLHILASQSGRRYFGTVLTGLSQAVENGSQLYEAMQGFPAVFSDVVINMVKVGELSGNLELNLRQLGVQLEREADLRSRVRGAMIYPVVIIAAMILVGIVMSIFVLPKLTSVFKEFNTDLPLMTRLLMNFSDFMAAHIILVITGLVVLVTGIVYGFRTSFGKAVIYRASLVLPGIGPLTVKINVARFTRVLASLLKSGISIVEALKVAGGSIPNTLYRQSLAAAAEQVKVGKNLTAVLTLHPRLFPPLVVQMLEVGEETGNLESILEQVAVHFEAQIDERLKNMSSIIEPLLLLVIGGVVGLMAYALVVPIYNIGSQVK